MDLNKCLEAWAESKGFRVAVAPIALVDEVRRSIEKRRDSGEIEAAFYRNNLSSFAYLRGYPLESPSSIIIVAMPRPAHILSFSVGGSPVETIIPPTYVRYRKTFEEVRDDLAEAVAGFKGRLEILSAPLKALANRMGLLAHGRNNIGYIEGMGSYFQLIGLITDVRFMDARARLRPEEMLWPRCHECRICAAACPTGAIDPRRILLRTEKCYTLFSESMDPFPEGLKPPSPNCLVGCLRCQEVCPENRGRLRFAETGISFTENETVAFLNLSPASRQDLDWARDKLRPLGCSEDALPFARNLRLNLQARPPAR